MEKKCAFGFWVLISIFALVLPTICQAVPPATNKHIVIRGEDPSDSKTTVFVPYIFPSESMGTTFGLGAMVKGYHQEQLLFGVTVFGSTDAAGGMIAGMWDYRLPWLDNLYFSAMGSAGYYPRQRAYTSLDHTGTDTDAGSNDSDKNDYMEYDGFDKWFDYKFEYVLPIGSLGKKRIITYHLYDGILKSGSSGGDVWNPFTSGITTLVIKQSNRYQSYNTDDGTVSGTIHPVEIGLRYDNTDFTPNPSKGSSQYIGLTHDFGWAGSETAWTFFEIEASKYFNLGPSKTARQRVIALNAWTGDTLSYNTSTASTGDIIRQNNAPFLAGARLGGFWRMRGFDTNRFNDRSVVYASAEYRHTLIYNPIRNIAWLEFLQLDWFQIVGFVEGGRVANQYQISTLLSNWKKDIGLGIRAMVAGGIVRFDYAYSNEGSHAWFMVGQPF